MNLEDKKFNFWNSSLAGLFSGAILLAYQFLLNDGLNVLFSIIGTLIVGFLLILIIKYILRL